MMNKYIVKYFNYIKGTSGREEICHLDKDVNAYNFFIDGGFVVFVDKDDKNISMFSNIESVYIEEGDKDND